MSTFFEKLTASRPKVSGSSVVTADMGASKHRSASPQSSSRENASEDVEIILDQAPISEKSPKTGNYSPKSAQTEDNLPKEGEEEGELTVDIYEKDDVIIIQSTVAGVKPEDLEVSITSEMVRIKGTRAPTDRVSEEHYYYKELFWGTFARTVILPEEIDENHTEASLKHGLLTVSLPKKKKGIAQKVKIRAV
jgi:HSP20 family protein